MTEISGESPRIGVLSDTPDFAEKVRGAGGKAVAISMPEFYGEWGVALAREWVSDRMEIEVPFLGLDALAFDADSPEELAGIVVAAIRLGLPAVCLSPLETPFSVAVAALGLSPLDEEDPAEVAVRLARDGGPDAGSLADNFALANALRAGLMVGGGPEAMVHLAAIAKEADDVVGFDQMLRVLASETPVAVSVDSEWFDENGLPGVLHLLGDSLHDTRTVSGSLKSHARAASSEPSDEKFRLSFVKARTSGAEAVCLAPEGLAEVEGECRVFDSEAEAVEAVEAVAGGGLEDVGILVVRGCGPRGYPGLCRLDELAHAIEEAGVEGMSILTDGLAPEEAPGVWISLFSPEAASRGVVSRLEDGDFLKFDLEEGRILTSVGARDFARRKRFKPETSHNSAYAARYAKAAETALGGASFR